MVVTSPKEVQLAEQARKRERKMASKVGMQEVLSKATTEDHALEDEKLEIKLRDGYTAIMDSVRRCEEGTTDVEATKLGGAWTKKARPLSEEEVVDFKPQIKTLLLKAKLLRETLCRASAEIKKLKVVTASKPLATLSTNIINDIREILKSQRRHVLGYMIRRGVREIGRCDMKVLVDQDLAPYLSVKERRTSLPSLVKETRDEGIKTQQAYERLSKLCETSGLCCMRLVECIKLWLLPLLKSPHHCRPAKKIISIALQDFIEVTTTPSEKVPQRKTPKYWRRTECTKTKQLHHPAVARPSERVEQYLKIIGVLGMMGEALACATKIKVCQLWKVQSQAEPDDANEAREEDPSAVVTDVPPSSSAPSKT